ncbi:putative membrane protein YeiB [Murinocardiopsis flavida]|uniref:Putative membrane protein YeiB n=1 Tax=Murinocardiopsis flavida TaxID=645275 RepID=A0A2P8CF29_9ACTN|nr:DUF418 domain-containing protein [Murinocardiopsis flavida]PSK83556.1 putative membrane protein YeiB [Murinocardiopsis flavida]
MPDADHGPEPASEDPAGGSVAPLGPLRGGGAGGPASTSTGRPRIAALDVLRGFALCAILFANIRLMADGDTAVATPPAGAVHAWIGLPIFSLLFGIGFALLLDSAANRVPRPRLVLLRRLAALLAIGLLHTLLWPGEVLTPYAVVGLLVLLPSTWLPRWAVAGLATAFATAALVGGGGPLMIAGLFLLGSALVRYGVVDRIDRSVRGPLLLGLALGAGAALAAGVHAAAPTTAGAAQSSIATSLFELLLTGVLVCTLLVLLGTPLRPVLLAVFAPMGRMALTNYLTATVLVLATGHLLGVPIGQSAAAALTTAGVILTVQWLFSTLWLRRYSQGPAEWLWRWATWASRPAALRTPEIRQCR